MRLRKAVFFPPFLLLLASALLSIVWPEDFLVTVRAINNWILVNFDWLFSWGTFSFLLILLAAYFSSFSRIKIGGEKAVPFLTRWQWFSITLCTTIATGILFWGTAEPLYHAHQGPIGMENENRFAMSTMFMHWTLTPYGMYTLAGLVFAYCYYNLKQPFSVSTLLYPLLGDRVKGPVGPIVDAICLFALVSGMAASLGAGIMSISGGLQLFWGIPYSTAVYGLIGLGIVLAFVISSSTGLTRGIRVLSVLNIRFFIVFALFVFFAGPTVEMLKIGGSGLGDYFLHFIPRSVGMDPSINEEWVQSWTVFYWANWLAWTPVTALFLGRLAYGYTIREFIHFNLLLPALFSAFWMIVFSGATIAIDGTTGEMFESLSSNGEQSVIYALLSRLPFAGITSFIFLLIVFISYVTAADSNTSAMTGMSVHGITPENPEAPLWIKVVWGALVGLIAWIMISFAGIDGIKMTSNLGGFPALFIVLLVGVGLLKLIYINRAN